MSTLHAAHFPPYVITAAALDDGTIRLRRHDADGDVIAEATMTVAEARQALAAKPQTERVAWFPGITVAPVEVAEVAGILTAAIADQE